jgi:hypothetical protein
VRTIPDPGFAGDDGTAPETLTVALAAYDADPDAGYLQALAALCTSRLLVPVVAVLGEVGYDEAGLAHDKSSDMLVDVAGPVRFVVEGEDLSCLARGWRLVRLEDGWGWLATVGDGG